MRAMEPRASTAEHETSVEIGRLLVIEEVAERLSVSARFVRRLIAERRIRYFKIGRHVRIAEDDIEDWVRQRSVEPRATK